MLPLLLLISLIIAPGHGADASAKAQLMAAFRGGDNAVFACPVSLNTLQKKTRMYGAVRETFYEDELRTRYPMLRDGILDLTIASEVNKPIWDLGFKELIGQNLFQTPIMSGIYERGYRQNFENFGFPGIEKEFGEVNEFFQSIDASVILDLSCGSGFMTRRFIKSNKYSRVISGDLSLTMLRETRGRCLQENLIPELIRCDSSKLPIVSGSLDAVHAGAAMHCWPKVSRAVQEIYRTLRPGGVFFATTILTSAYMGAAGPNSSGFTLFRDTNELDKIVSDAGFSRVQVRKEGRGCAVIRAYKD